LVLLGGQHLKFVFDSVRKNKIKIEEEQTFLRDISLRLNCFW